MGIKLEVELLMPAMPSSFQVKSVRPSKLDHAHSHLRVSVGDLDEESVAKICAQWAVEFREFASRQRAEKDGRRASHYLGGEDEPE
jgi:hypothetical protein